MNKRVELTTQLLNQLTRYFSVFHQDLRVREVQARIDPESIIRYGRFRMAGDGDKMRTAKLIDCDPIARDNSFIKVSLPFNYLLDVTYMYYSLRLLV